MTDEDLSVRDIANEYAQRLRSRARRMAAHGERFARNQPEAFRNVQDYLIKGDAADFLVNPSLARDILKSEIEKYKEGFYITGHDPWVLENLERYKKERPYISGCDNAITFSLSQDGLDKEKEFLDGERKRLQQELLMLGPKNSFDIASFAIFTKNRRADIQKKIDRIAKCGRLVQRLDKYYEEARATAVEEYADPRIAKIKIFARFVAAQKRLASRLEAVEIFGQISGVIQWEKICMPDIPEWHAPHGGIGWRKIGQAYKGIPEKFKADMHDYFRDKALKKREQSILDYFRATWRLDSTEQRDHFFSDDNLRVVKIEDRNSLVAGAESLEIYYKDRHSETGILSAHILYFPEKRALGIESVWVNKKYRGQGDFKHFMRALVRMGEAQGIEDLTLLAGESSGPPVWARLGAHIHDEDLQLYEGLTGYLKGDHYSNWQQTISMMRGYKMRDAKDAGADPDLLRQITELIGKEGDPMPPKANFYELTQLTGRIEGVAPIDYLLGKRDYHTDDRLWQPFKYRAQWNFKDPEQMANLKRAIGMDNAEPHNLPQRPIREEAFYGNRLQSRTAEFQ